MQPFQPQTVYDFLGPFDAGVNNGLAPLRLQKNQLALGINTTVRGTYVTQRPSFTKLDLGSSASVLLGAFASGAKFQGACYFQSDDSTREGILCAIGGRLYEVLISGSTGTVTDVTAADCVNSPAQDLEWLFQAEKWVIVNDGYSVTGSYHAPIYYDVNAGTTSRSAGSSGTTNYNTTVSVSFTLPAIGSTVTGVTLADITNIVVGDLITITNIGVMQVQSISSPTVDLLNVSGTPAGQTIQASTAVSWQHVVEDLPPGRIGAYVMGRIWLSLPDGKSFVASDIVGGSSGTKDENYRDAILKITENSYLAGGGIFTIPGTLGGIRAMISAPTLDASMGQGPMQVFTPNVVFSCNAPADRTTWQNLTYPILSESLIVNGGQSDGATIPVNGDILYRSLDGIRSLTLSRRDFNTWGNTPISFEVNSVLRDDNPSLLVYGSAVVFDNRFLMTAEPVLTGQGVVHRKMIALNFDPVSSLRGKAPSVYDALHWTGLQVFRLVVGEFTSVQRAFAITWNQFTAAPEIWEIQRDEDAYLDAGVDRIAWEFESPSLFVKQQEALSHTLLRLTDGEIYVDEVEGQVDFQSYYKPDQWPCWVPWFQWSACQTQPTSGTAPGYRARMGMGQPSAADVDLDNNRPLREGFTFQFKLILTGKCRFLGARFSACTAPQPQFAKPDTLDICNS